MSFSPKLLLQDITNGIRKAIQGSPGVSAQLSNPGLQLLPDMLYVHLFQMTPRCHQAIVVVMEHSRDPVLVLMRSPPSDSGSS
ncbi:UNVERIFIED_CONTAM: hypothetical protein K2H54_009482 [Gekko kuhli]